MKKTIEYKREGYAPYEEKTLYRVEGYKKSGSMWWPSTITKASAIKMLVSYISHAEYYGEDCEVYKAMSSARRRCGGRDWERARSAPRWRRHFWNGGLKRSLRKLFLTTNAPSAPCVPADFRKTVWTGSFCAIAQR